jgi:hypothetical protein
MSNASRRPRVLTAAFGSAVLLAGITTATVLAGEIKDSNEELEKIVWSVDAQSTRDPELSVGGEKVQVEPGDLITFRIGINEDAVEEDEDGIAVVEDVFKKADLEYVSSDSEFDPEDCDPPAVASAPADNKVVCRLTLGPDGNARLYLTFRVLPPSGNPQGCVPGTNVVNTDGASSAAEGGDQAQYEICPEGSLAGEVESSTGSGSGGTDAVGGTAGIGGGGTGALPDAAMPAPSSGGGSPLAVLAALTLMAAAVVGHAARRTTRWWHPGGAPDRAPGRIGSDRL